VRELFEEKRMTAFFTTKDTKFLTKDTKKMLREEQSIFVSFVQSFVSFVVKKHPSLKTDFIVTNQTINPKGNR